MVKPRVLSPVPFIIVTHNRLSGLINVLDFLRTQDFPVRIIIADMKSTYSPMISYLNSLKPDENLQVWNCENIGPRGLFFDARFRNFVSANGGSFFLADGDLDYSVTSIHLLQELVRVSKRFPGFHKVGAGLRLDDLPDHSEALRNKSQIIRSGEIRNFLETREIASNVFLAPLDTTVAYYPRLTKKYYFWPTLRVGGSCLVRHTPWYEDDSNLTQEQSYYFVNQRKDISTMGGRQLVESNGSENLLIDRLAGVIRPLLSFFPSWGSRTLSSIIQITNKHSYLNEA
jgi:hypothetical protein